MAKRIPRYQREADRQQPGLPPVRGRTPADLSQQAPHNSYGAVPLYYEDTPFTCVDCGKEEVWTAEQQKWWYEVAKGSIYSRAARCRECRRARREGKARPEVQPIRHIGILMKLIRAEIEPALLAAGFVFASQNKPAHPSQRLWVDYVRAGQTFSFAYRQRDARLTAEVLDPNGDCRVIAVEGFHMPRTRADVMVTVKQFSAKVIEYLAEGGHP